MRNAELVPVFAGVDYVSRLEGLPVATSFKIAKAHSQLKRVLEPFDTLRNTIVLKYIDPKTNNIKDPQLGLEFQKALGDLLNQEVEYSIPDPPLFALQDLAPAKKAKPQQLEVLLRTNFISAPELKELSKDEFPVQKQFEVNIGKLEELLNAVNDVASRDLPFGSKLFTWALVSISRIMKSGIELSEAENKDVKTIISLPTITPDNLTALGTIQPNTLSVLSDLVE